jgi:hypothetical protein
MAWHLRTGSSTESVAYESEGAAVAQVNGNITRQRSLGHKDSRDKDGRVLFHDGSQLVDYMWVETEDGKVIPIP